MKIRPGRGPRELYGLHISWCRPSLEFLPPWLTSYIQDASVPH
jgi:hypothetical protein